MARALLVLLVIFLASITLSEKGIDATLPKETQKAARLQGPPPPGQILLEYTADHRISVNHQDLPAADLQARLREIYEERADKTLFISGDGSLPYRAIIEVMDAAKGAGVQRVGIVTEGMKREAGVTIP